MTQVTPTDKCRSCGGSAFRSDRPYGNFCSMMCSLRGIPTEAEKKEEDERWKLILESARTICTTCKKSTLSPTQCARCLDKGCFADPFCEVCIFQDEIYGDVCDDCNSFLLENP